MNSTLNESKLDTCLDHLGRLMEYPHAGFNDLVDVGQRLVIGAGQARFREFADGILELTPDEREELYTSTFDVTPACVPYLGIHLFGEESFKRGEFMAALNARFAAAGRDAGIELPDHLANVLQYAATAEERRELVQFCLLGPLGKMIRALNEINPYRALLEVILATLQEAYPGLEAPLSPLEQMQRGGIGCAVVSAGCGSCGSVAGEPVTTMPQPVAQVPNPNLTCIV